jgi:hypothetical protein
LLQGVKRRAAVPGLLLGLLLPPLRMAMRLMTASS